MESWSRAVALKLECGAEGWLKQGSLGSTPRVSNSLGLRSEPREFAFLTGSEKQIAAAGLGTTL